MFAAQEKFREGLLQQTPENVLEHAYEYTAREDILLWLEFNNLEPAQAKALLRLPDPLNTVFQDLDHRENSHMDDIADVIEDRANQEVTRRREKQSEHFR